MSFNIDNVIGLLESINADRRMIMERPIPLIDCEFWTNQIAELYEIPNEEARALAEQVAVQAFSQMIIRSRY